jgi:tripartite-type tricarboxylate transporter receptor subunit TctC
MRFISRILATAAALAVATSAGLAQGYPTKPIQFIIGFSPGGPSDVMSRVITKKLEEQLKQPVVLDNKPGAGGSIAASYVSRAAPDGYTLMLATAGIIAINPHIYKNVGYDPVKSFAPITLLGTQPSVLYVHPSFPAKDIKELIEGAKANPGKFNFASGGNGTPQHLVGELLKVRAGIDIAHVPFKGTGPALQSVLAGQIQMAFSSIAPLVGHFKTGAIRPIAVSSLGRSATLPDVPSIAESGFPGFELNAWHGIVAPAGTPPDIVAKLNSALHEVFKDPWVIDQMSKMGVELSPTTPEQFAAHIQSEMPKWEEAIKASGAKVQ